MDRYEIIMYWSNEDEAFIAEVPNFPDAWRMVIHRKRHSPASRKRCDSGSKRRANSGI